MFNNNEFRYAAQFAAARAQMRKNPCTLEYQEATNKGLLVAVIGIFGVFLLLMFAMWGV